MLGNKAYWLCQIGAWSLYALGNFFLISSYTSLPARGVLGVLSYGPLGIAVTHALRAYIHRSRLASHSPRQIVIACLYLVPGFALLLTFAIMLAFLLWTGSAGNFQGVSVLQIAIGTYFNMNFLIAIWLSIYFAVHAYQQNITSREAQLRALESQINPHFLFNSLNSLRALIAENPSSAQDAVTRLSQLLRYSLAQSRRPNVPLSEELDAVRDYLALEQLRLEDRLCVQWRIDPATEPLRLPPMSLQILVENAIKHGIGNLAQGGELLIESRLEPHGWLLRVVNPVASPVSSTAAPSTGTGLENVRARLRLLAGDRAGLSVAVDAAQAIATISLPL